MEVQAAAVIIPSTSTTSPDTLSIPMSPSSFLPVESNVSNVSDKSWSAISTIAPAITPENDPNPSWTFFPPSATYIPPSSTCPSTTSVTSPTSVSPSSPPRSPRSTPSPVSTHTSNGNVHSNGTTAPTSTPTTHHRILDHCFHVSIETRLKQAEAQYLASTQEQALEQQRSKDGSQDHDQDQDQDWHKRQRSLVDEAVVLGRKGSNVEAIVDGILKSHRSNGPLQTLPRHLKHRLHLCQLTSMVFGRFDVASSTNNSAGLNIYSAFHSRRHGTSRAAIKQRFTNSEQGRQLQPLFAHPIPASLYCRRHHRRDCKRTCCTLAKLQQEQQQALELKKKMTNNYFLNNVRKQEHQRVAGMVDAIPAFLKCSAMSYRDIAKGMVDKGEIQDMKDMKVLEGWYKLLLEMMTQTAIESYLCDEDIGLDTILDVFSYGDDPDSEETALKDFTVKVSLEPSSLDSPSSGTETGVEGLHFQTLSSLSSTALSPLKSQYHSQQSGTPLLHDVTTQDRQDDILFAKTPEYRTFKNAKDERLQEFLQLNGATMERHFAELAARYPLIVFERQMTHFIARSQQLLVDPTLSQSNSDHHPLGLLAPPTTSAYADGSLSMPVSEDEDEDEDEDVAMDDDNWPTRLEGIKEEDENEGYPVVVIKEATRTGYTCDDDDDDDDNSTAARVVQVSKKHKHHAESALARYSGVDTGDSMADGGEAGHHAKKIKV
ncbi:MAG: hypothetical protein J3Q66DRAFT_327860 [Benniella sp.]|nr:MAG: hypothetical protein J3Q66DRAFT_327860 [Benniella sp.]